MASYANQLIFVDSADFDGTSDYMTRGAGLTGAADSKTGIFSCWTRIDGGDGTIRRFFNAANGVGGALKGFRVSLNATNNFIMTGLNAAGTVIFQQYSTTAYVAGATWRHLLASWSMTVTAHLYVTDVSDRTSLTFTDDTLDYTETEWAVGAVANGAEKWNGCLAELYFAPGQYLDFSVEANRRKFISASGKPANMGFDGSVPTGIAPLAYQHLNKGNAVADFAINRGTGGNFSITGTLDTGSSSPSD